MDQKEGDFAGTEKDNIMQRVNDLLKKMSLSEKIGQMSQFQGRAGIPADLKEAIQKGKVGSVLNEIDTDTINELQRIALEESRMGIPILIGRDVIHGFHTVLPIPLGLAASWNPGLVEQGCRMAAVEAASVGIRWTFAPMIDITRDPRWGRIAESPGEDPFLAGVLGAAMVRGFQGDQLSAPDSLAACAKHFAGYGYSEAGKDYAYVNISENELRNIVLPPFKACVEAGVATFMTAFSDLNGVPATGNEFLLRKVLREEWCYEGFVVSDYDSVVQLMTHGFAENEEEAAFESLQAGVDMEMASHAYLEHLESLVEEGRIAVETIDQCVRNILKVKIELGLFENPYTRSSDFPPTGNTQNLEVARQAALESCVLLQNEQDVLPLDKNKIRELAIIGPLADDGFEQLGTWTFDGKAAWSQTPLQSIRTIAAEHFNIWTARGLETTRTKNRNGFAEALEAAGRSDAVILFLGEEAILSGESHCRADIDLPGYQNELLQEIFQLGKPTILVIMAGRPLTLDNTRKNTHAILYAWHPGTMAGPAIADLLFGTESPSGKLPVSFPKMVGQIPVYYNQRNSGRPPGKVSFTHMDDIPVRAFQLSIGNTSYHMDAGFEPLYRFGFGMSYTHFEYGPVVLSKEVYEMDEVLEFETRLSNTGRSTATEVVQLYIRDRVGSVTRPVRELKGFQRVRLKPGEHRKITFRIHTDELAFYDRKMKKVTEPGWFDAGIGGDSSVPMTASFEIR